MATSLRIETLSGREYRLVGEMDLSNADQLRGIEGGGDVALDLSELAFMDSTGLRAIIELARRLEPDGHLVLRNPTGTVDRLFEVTGIHRIPNLSVERS
jgi:anti-anti-sigma factor